MSKIISNLTIVITFIVGLGVSIADFLGYINATLPANSPYWLKFVGDIPKMTLMLVSALALYLFSERFESSGSKKSAEIQLSEHFKGVNGNIENISTNVIPARFQKVNDDIKNLKDFIVMEADKLVESTNGVRVEKLSVPIQAFEYLSKRIPQAKSEILDLAWSPKKTESLVSKRDTHSEDAYNMYINSVCKWCGRDDVKYVEIAGLPSKLRAERVQRIIGAQTNGYYFHYYKLENEHTPPLIGFTIIDDEEVIMFTYSTNASGQESCLKIKHNKMIVSLFKLYFALVLDKSPAGYIDGKFVDEAQELMQIK